MGDTLTIFIRYFFPAIMVGIILFDFFSMTIPNWLNALLMVGFIGLIFAVNLPMVSIGWHLFAAFITLAIGFGAFALNFFGGGDAKSVAAIAAWLGWSLDTALFLLIMAILGGLFAIILLIIRYMNIGKMLPKKVSEINWVKAIVTPEMRMPYGVAIGAAGLVIYTPDKWLML